MELREVLINLTKDMKRVSVLNRKMLSKGLDKEYQQVFEITEYLNEINPTFGARVYCIIKNITSIPTCKTCGKYVKFNTFKAGYRDFCSNKCIGLNKDIQKQKEESCLKSIGQKTPLSGNYKNKFIQDKYGVENISQLQWIKDKKIETYTNRSDEEKQIFRENMEQTCLEKYGETHWMKTDEYKNLFKENFKNFSDEKWTKILNERCKTNLKKYGVEHVLQSDDIKNKSKQTCLEKYGVEYYSQTDAHTIKFKSTKLRKYGDENYVNIEKYKETMLEKYGVECNWQRPEIRKHAQETHSRLINELIESNCEVDCDFKKLAKNEGIFWNLGLNETWMLNNIEHALNIKLIRQKSVCGFYVDGYDKVNNVCYEIDENYHLNEEQSESDKLREQKIIKELGCTFVRIPDYTH